MAVRHVSIEGFVAIDPPADLDGTHLEVQLRDSGMADVTSTVVGRCTDHCSGIAVASIAFALQAAVEPGRQYTLAAEVRRGDALAPGDLLNIASHPWRQGDANPVRIAVQPVR